MHIINAEGDIYCVRMRNFLFFFSRGMKKLADTNTPVCFQPPNFLLHVPSFEFVKAPILQLMVHSLFPPHLRPGW